MVSRIGLCVLLLLFLGLAGPPRCTAQSKLGLQDAINKALESRASLKADAERISTARGLKQQAGLIPNPEFQFSNENLGPGQTYTQDVDTLAYVTQPLDILGKRKQRIAAAASGVNRSQAEYEMARLEIIQRVKLAYWAARGSSGDSGLIEGLGEGFSRDRRLSLVAFERGGHLRTGFSPRAAGSRTPADRRESSGDRSDACSSPVAKRDGTDGLFRSHAGRTDGRDRCSDRSR